MVFSSEGKEKERELKKDKVEYKTIKGRSSDQKNGNLICSLP